jgi:hypothetical protein
MTTLYNMSPESYKMYVTPHRGERQARLRGITAVASKSPSVVAAIVEFCFGRLIANPQQIGHALGRERSGWRSARVGQYRVIYWIDESERIV